MTWGTFRPISTVLPFTPRSSSTTAPTVTSAPVPAVEGTMISGSVPEMLTHIRDIGSEVLCNGSMSVPYISFDGVTISGK